MTKAPKFALYSAVSESEEFRPHAFGVKSRLIRSLRRRIDYANWRLQGFCAPQVWVHEDLGNSNVGDVAIRKAIMQLCESAYQQRLAFLNHQWNDTNDTLIRRINEECQALIIGGSGYFHFRSDGELSERVKNDLLFFRKLSVPIIGVGIGINVSGLQRQSMANFYPSVDSASLIQEMGSMLSGCSTRDSFSKKVLDPFFPSGVSQVPDPALLLRCNRSGNQQPSEAGRLHIGLNLAFHSSGLQQRLRRQLPVFADALRRIKQTYNANFTYFVHSDAERIFPVLFRSAGVPMRVIASRDPCDYISAYAQQDLHVCQMLHSSILAINAGVPVINFSYDVKNIAFFDDLGLAEYCVPSDSFSVDALMERIEGVLINKATIASKLKFFKEIGADRMRHFMTSVIGRVTS